MLQFASLWPTLHRPLNLRLFSNAHSRFLSNRPSQAGNNSLNKAGNNSPCNNGRVGLSRSNLWFNLPFAQAFTAEAVASVSIRIGDSVQCVGNRIWATDSVGNERTVLEQRRFIEPKTGRGQNA